MKPSTTRAEPRAGRGARVPWPRRLLRTALPLAFYLIIWHVGARAVGQAFLLASPWQTAKTLFSLWGKTAFWSAIGFSFTRIAAGFLLAVLAGTLCAVAAAHSRTVLYLASPLMSVIKSMPVASFVILALLWIPSRNLSVLTSFLMALPVLYTSVLEGMRQIDPALQEMAAVFRMRRGRRVALITVPQVAPYFVSACYTALGLCWKAGVAAEVIGVPTGSIGARLYQAKLYLETGELFAWTLTIVCVSMLCEHLMLLALAWTRRAMQEG